MPWDVGQKKYIRDNSRNVGPVVWGDDATAGQVVDSNGHDYHDQDIANGITECLNINGINQMLQNFDMGGLKIINLDDATMSGEAVSWDQFQTNTAAIAQNTADIAALGGGVADELVTAQSFDGVTFKSVRTDGDFDTPINVYTSLKANGQIRQLLGTAVAINVSTGNRFSVANAGSITLTFSGLPTGADASLGANYRVEGQVTVWNGAGAITGVTIAGLTSPRTIGIPSTTSNGVGILTYLFDVIGGTLARTTLIWSVN